MERDPSRGERIYTRPTHSSLLGPRPPQQSHPARPTPHPTGGSGLRLVTNYFPFSHKNSDAVYKYSVSFMHDTMEVPDDNRILRRKLMRELDNQLRKKLAVYVFLNTAIYTLLKVNDIITLPVVYDGVNYTVIIRFATEVDMLDRQALYKHVFIRAIQQVKYSRLGRRYFDPLEKHKMIFENTSIRLLQGYTSAIQSCDAGVLLKVDVCFRALRRETALEFINDMFEKELLKPMSV